MDLTNPMFQGILTQLDKALTEKAELDEKKKVVDEQVEGLVDAVRALHRVYGGTLPDPISKQVDGDLGITDQVREVMKTSGATTWLQPTQVRTLVEGRGFALGGYSNPMAVIHQVLKRLEKQGELDMHGNGANYKLKPKK